jgi:hypothetical protein
MTFFADGSTYCYLADSEEGQGVNVGWLAAGHDFAMGSCAEGFVEALVELIASPVNQTKGFHYCDLCPAEAAPESIHTEIDGKTLELGDAEVWVAASDGPRFAAPTLIVHYVLVHGYQPPEEFQQAVMAAARRAAA